MYNSVTHENCSKETVKTVNNVKQLFQRLLLPPLMRHRGVDLPIKMTIDHIIFLINSVTHDSG